MYTLGINRSKGPENLKTFYAFWPFIYTAAAFWGPENTNCLKTGFKVEVFESDTIIVAV